MAEEIKNPQRNIPIALFGGISLLILLYLGANCAYHAVIPMEEMALPQNQEHVAELMVKQLLGPIGGSLMSIGVMVSVLGAINSNLLLGPRVYTPSRGVLDFSNVTAGHSYATALLLTLGLSLAHRASRWAGSREVHLLPFLIRPGPKTRRECGFWVTPSNGWA